MEILLGASITFNIFLVGGFIAYLKYKPKEEKEQLTPEEKQKRLQQKEHFNKMMNYNVQQAYGGK